MLGYSRSLKNNTNTTRMVNSTSLLEKNTVKLFQISLDTGLYGQNKVVVLADVISEPNLFP